MDFIPPKYTEDPEYSLWSNLEPLRILQKSLWMMGLEVLYTGIVLKARKQSSKNPLKNFLLGALFDAGHHFWLAKDYLLLMAVKLYCESLC